MATYLPQTFNDLAMIKGMGDRSLSKYGEGFLTAIQNFSRENGLGSRMHLKEEEIRQAKISKRNKRPVEGDTRTQSFKLFQSGKTVPEIALQRGLTEGTIQAHLCSFIQTGEIDIFNLLSKEKFEIIKSTLVNTTEGGTSAVKNKLGDEYSYGEIRFVIASLQFKKNENSSVENQMG
jgi:ATP-dependent DNA helicase RecQ